MHIVLAECGGYALFLYENSKTFLLGDPEGDLKGTIMYADFHYTQVQGLTMA